MPGPRLRACPHCELRKVGYHRSMSTSCAVLILHLCLLAQLRSTWGSHDDPATLYLATKPEQPSMLLLSAMGNQTINRIVLTSDYTMARSPEMPDTPAVLVSRCGTDSSSRRCQIAPALKESRKLAHVGLGCASMLDCCFGVSYRTAFYECCSNSTLLAAAQ